MPACMPYEVLLKTTFWRMLRRITGKVLYEKIRARKYLGYIPNLKNPKTFNEKIINYKLFGLPKIIITLTDKYEVRNYIENKISPQILVKNYYVGDDPEKIPFHDLPDAFVVKTTHSSGGVFIVRNKHTEDIEKLKIEIGKSLKSKLGLVTNEWWYQQIKPRFIIEGLLNDGNNEIPLDYKLFCFNGRCELIQVDYDRFKNHTRTFYDRDWNKQDFTFIYPHSDRNDKPENLCQLINIAEKLAKDFVFIRIDLYSICGEVKFGEMTFAPEAGYGRFDSYDSDLRVGKYWDAK